MDINSVLKMSCIEGMKLLDDNSVDMCVTSPPYDDLRTYNDSSKWDFPLFEKVAELLGNTDGPGKPAKKRAARKKSSTS